MTVTIKELAQLCNVSEGTVDRALNDRKGISPKTKKRILKAAQELNYLPNHLARGLAKGQSFTLGVVLFDVTNPYLAQLMTAMEIKARELGYVVFPIFTHNRPENEQIAFQHFQTRRVDGIILFSVQKGEAFEQQLKEMNIPIVTIGNRISPSFPYVGINERESMRDAVQYVVDKGYEQIVYVCPPLAHRGKVNLYTLEERLAGCREVLAERALPEPIVITDRNYLLALQDMDWSSSVRHAVVCPADYYALEVLSFFKKQKIRVPEQVGIMGFDDIDMLKHINPKLCTVKYPAKEIAVTAINYLIDQINENERKHLSAMLLQHQVVEGESL
ncbi:LacI family DNA-binding transcriptional regulator [Paenibacillus abyssi]|uniref:LacI family transcriptional regulator n=1 Tax=Paenibacillus abyssi TaxID=1340531 RepID=A0A917CNE2_9BACL|nr:LacI family DNA-binding transcriptional regulator [Paenibacillus abyssi]GGF93889.1 LacI family transcriptional regulator [Paenibacillus abyssi]